MEELCAAKETRAVLSDLEEPSFLVVAEGIPMLSARVFLMASGSTTSSRRLRVKNHVSVVETPTRK